MGPAQLFSHAPSLPPASLCPPPPAVPLFTPPFFLPFGHHCLSFCLSVSLFNCLQEILREWKVRKSKEQARLFWGRGEGRGEGGLEREEVPKADFVLLYFE